MNSFEKMSQYMNTAREPMIGLHTAKDNTSNDDFEA